MAQRWKESRIRSRCLSATRTTRVRQQSSSSYVLLRTDNGTRQRERPQDEAPAWHGQAIAKVALAKLRRERRFLVRDDEHVEQDEYGDGVLEQSHAAKQPCLADERREDPVIHGIPSKAIEADDDEQPRRIERRQRAFDLGKEDPETEKKNRKTEEQ